jgi:regulator of sigma E protease
VLVIVHEAGHFFAAKKFGIRVDEFGFGFPPKLFGIKKGETEYTFNLLPLGGFVKIFGESPDEDSENGADSARSFINHPKWQQAVVLFAGVFANFLLAWLLFSVGFMSGLPTSVGSEPQGSKLSDIHLVVVSVLAKSPAEIAGLKSGDKMLSLDIREGNWDKYIGQEPGVKYETALSSETVRSFVLDSKGKKIEVHYFRGQDTTIKIAFVTPSLNQVTNNFEIGISMDEVGTAKLPLFTALSEGLALDWFITKSTAVGLYTLIKEGIEGRGSFAGVTGPVGMVGIVGDAYQFGFAYLLSFAALISVNLAIINLLPFPALDGGRLLFLLIEKIKGSRINPKVANTLNTIGFSVLILLMLIVTYHDVIKLF